MILQQWLWSDYQLYDYFNHKLIQEIRQIGEDKVEEDLRNLHSANKALKAKCNAHFVDNESLKGTPMHMAHHMVKAYDINANCTFYAISEPAFYNLIKKQQKKGRPVKQKIT